MLLALLIARTDRGEKKNRKKKKIMQPTAKGGYRNLKTLVNFQNSKIII